MTPIKHYPPKPQKVYFYGTCLIDVFYPGAGLDAIRLLEREGIEVIFPRIRPAAGSRCGTTASPMRHGASPAT
jgi:L-lactate dehydrogenase complex protein LldE